MGPQTCFCCCFFSERNRSANCQVNHCPLTHRCCCVFYKIKKGIFLGLIFHSPALYPWNVFVPCSVLYCRRLYRNGKYLSIRSFGLRKCNDICLMTHPHDSKQEVLYYSRSALPGSSLKARHRWDPVQGRHLIDEEITNKTLVTRQVQRRN